MRLLALLAVALTASGAVAAVPARPKPPAPPVVRINKLAYGPAPAALRVGQTLVFANDDIFEHTATAAGDFDLDLKPGKSGAVVLKRAGVYKVTCRFHPTMKMQFAVKPAAPAKTARPRKPAR